MKTANLKEEIKLFLEKYPIEKVLALGSVQTKYVDLYYAAFNEIPDCGGCNNQTRKGLERLRLYAESESSNRVIIMKDQRYKMKDGARVYCSTLGIVLTSKNCTDNNAKILLATSPSASGQFTEIPKDWQKECKEALEAFKAGKEIPEGGSNGKKATKKEIDEANKKVAAAKKSVEDAEKILSGRKESMAKLQEEIASLDGEAKDEKVKLAEAYQQEVDGAEKDLENCKSVLESEISALESLSK